MQKESLALANALLTANKTSSVETFTVKGSTDVVIVVARRVKSTEAKTITENINKSANYKDSGQEVSFLPPGGCPCCGK